MDDKRIHWVIRDHQLQSSRHGARRDRRRHDGRVAVDRSKQRWCSDGFEFRCDDGMPLRVTFALDCCDRETISSATTTGGHSGDVIAHPALPSSNGLLVPHEFTEKFRILNSA